MSATLAPVTTVPLWDHQAAAVAFAAPRPAAMLAMPMGVGKSLCTVAIIGERGWSRSLILAPKSVVPHWPREFAKFAAYPVRCVALDERKSVAQRVAQAEAAARQPGPLVIVTNHEAAWRPQFSKFVEAWRPECLVVDECFPAGTPVLTPDGYRPIESVRIGDDVIGIDHRTGHATIVKVTSTFARDYKGPLEKIAGIEMTPEHPVWTERGYVSARDVRVSDALCAVEVNHRDGNLYSDVRVVRGSFAEDSAREGSGQEVLRSLVLGEEPHVEAGVRQVSRYSKAPGDVAREHEEAAGAPGRASETRGTSGGSGQSGERPGQPDQGSCNLAGTRLLDAERRQRPGIDGGAVALAAAAGVGGRVRGADAGTARAGVSDGIQTGSSGPGSTNWDRTRRSLSLLGGGQGKGREENGASRVARLDGASIPELGGDCGSGFGNSTSRRVYNIETESGNYVASGLLVHNCHRSKDPWGAFSKWLGRMAPLFKQRVGLTGTPFPHSPLDIFAQYRFLDARIFGHSFTRFRARYGVMGGWQGKQVVAYQNTEELAERFRSIAYECGADVVSLPETVDTTRTVVLGAHAARLYAQVARDFWAGVESGEITASNALTRMLRLQQITGGSVGLDLDADERPQDRRVEHVDTAKQDALRSVLEDLPEGEPVVVFARFTADLDAIHAAAKAAGAESLELSGRRRELEAWQHGAASVLAVQVQAGGVGVDLTRARVCVYYSLGFSLGEYLQSRKRTHRPGQTRSVLYVHLVAEGTIDEQVYRALEARQSVIEAVLSCGR